MQEAKAALAPALAKKLSFHVARNEQLSEDLAAASGRPIKDLVGFFDLIIGVNTFRYCHRLGNERECAADIYRLLRPGGVCVNIDMNNRFPVFRSKFRRTVEDPTECYVPTLEEYTSPFAAAGFEIKKKQKLLLDSTLRRARSDTRRSAPEPRTKCRGSKPRHALTSRRAEARLGRTRSSGSIKRNDPWQNLQSSCRTAVRSEGAPARANLRLLRRALENGWTLRTIANLSRELFRLCGVRFDTCDRSAAQGEPRDGLYRFCRQPPITHTQTTSELFA